MTLAQSLVKHTCRGHEVPSFCPWPLELLIIYWKSSLCTSAAFCYKKQIQFTDWLLGNIECTLYSSIFQWSILCSILYIFLTTGTRFKNSYKTNQKNYFFSLSNLKQKSKNNSSWEFWKTRSKNCTEPKSNPSKVFSIYWFLLKVLCFTPKYFTYTTAINIMMGGKKGCTQWKPKANHW